jgi:hypothetical protein
MRNETACKLPAGAKSALAFVSIVFLCAVVTAVAVCVGVLGLSRGGLFAKPTPPPVVNLSVAPASSDTGAVPEGAELTARTLAVADGARTVTPGALADKDFLYETLASETSEIAVLSARIKTPASTSADELVKNGTGGVSNPYRMKP